MAEMHFQTKVANISLMLPSQVLSIFVCLFVCSFLPCVPNVFVSPHPQFCLSTSSGTGCEFRRGLLFVYPPCSLFSVLITIPVPFYTARWLLEEEGA